MANFLSGSFIEVLYTDNTVARFPEHIGCIGIVEHAPIHPSTWFTIKMMDGRSIKLQTTAMKHVAKNDSRSQMVQNILTIPAQRPFSSSSATPIDIPKENHRPRSNSNIGIAHFTKGVSVIILRTDNVLHRVPHLVGVVGIIKEVPVHPITWFKIEFPSGQIATFRPSAFKLNDGKDEEVHRPSKKPTAFSTTYNQLYTKKTSTKDKEKSNDFEYTVGMHVSIRSGELSGESGEVLKSSNGWIQVLTPLGRVAKRAHELDNYDSNSTACPDTSRVLMTREQAEHLRMRPNHDLTNRCDQNGLKALKKAVFMSLHKDITTLGPKVSTQSPHKGEVMKRKHASMSSSDSSISPLYDLERQSLDCPFPLIPLHLRQAKRKRLQEYVDSESDYNQSRPDLSYWVQEIKGAFHSKDVYESETSQSIPPSSPRPDTVASSRHHSAAIVESANLEVNKVGDIPAPADNCPTSPDVTFSSRDIHHSSVFATIQTMVPVSEEKAKTSNCTEIHVERERDRSSSISETDCEESFSPEHTSCDVDEGEFSIPSPLSLPPAGNDYATHFLVKEGSIKGKKTVNIIQDESVDMNTNKSSNEQKNASKSFTFVNKPSFTAIPNPVQLFLPRHYSSQSCPTFSPFQTSTFSPFTSNSRKSPVVEQAGWKHFFPSEKNSFGGSPSPYVSCAFLPFNSAASPSSICNSKKSQIHEMIISSD